MCGVFGLILPCGTDAEVPARALLTLGTLAEERGIDAAGLAFWTGREGRTPGNVATIAGQPAAVVDGWQIRKRLGRFRDLPCRELAAEMRSAKVVLGHTRYAVQGDPFRLDNAGPLTVGQFVGAYSGDCDAADLRRQYRQRQTVGDTDGAAVLHALSDGADIPAVLEVLGTLRGKAAMAWADRERPERVWLARVACTPLAVAYTAGGAALWASNPEWLRHAAFSWGIDLTGNGPQMLPEGTLLALDAGTRVRPASQWTFTPASAGALEVAA